MNKLLRLVGDDKATKVLYKLNKHVERVRHPANEAERADAEGKLAIHLQNAHFLLYGDTDKEPEAKHARTLVSGLLAPGREGRPALLYRLAVAMPSLEFESTKRVAGVLNYVFHRCKENGAAAHVASWNRMNPPFLQVLLDGYSDPERAQSVGSVLQEMSKRKEFVGMLLATDAVVDRLFAVVQMPQFQVASDGLTTLATLLTSPGRRRAFSDASYFLRLNQLALSDNYVTQRLCLKLLAELLLERRNFDARMEYVGKRENLRLAMGLLRSKSRSIALAAFNVFKVFVMTPHKSEAVEGALARNRDKLVKFFVKLQGDMPEDAKVAQEMGVVVERLRALQVPATPRRSREGLEEGSAGTGAGTRVR